MDKGIPDSIEQRRITALYIISKTQRNTVKVCMEVFCLLPCAETPKLNLENLFGAKEIRVRAGDTLNIQLGVSGTPDPTVEWKKDGVSVSNRVSSKHCLIVAT